MQESVIDVVRVAHLPILLKKQNLTGTKESSKKMSEKKSYICSRCGCMVEIGGDHPSHAAFIREPENGKVRVVVCKDCRYFLSTRFEVHLDSNEFIYDALRALLRNTMR
jgi:DNA-directed RNA polymerase subunit RPC12/RpoP